MAIEPFLAMTGAEIAGKPEFPKKTAWMACHFSPYGPGLSNLPKFLPPGSLLMVDDATPIGPHDPEIILRQLHDCVVNLGCSGVLLDFQRPDRKAAASLAERLVTALPCPVAVSHFYADVCSCPVCLPPVPPSTAPEDHLAPWRGREIWLELALNGEEITVTEEGSAFMPLPNLPLSEEGFRDTELCCHYRCTQGEAEVKFLLWRAEEDLEDLLKQAENFGVTAAVGLFQEFRKSISCP